MRYLKIIVLMLTVGIMTTGCHPEPELKALTPEQGEAITLRCYKAGGTLVKPIYRVYPFYKGRPSEVVKLLCYKNVNGVADFEIKEF